jgi:hypothetical protein
MVRSLTAMQNLNTAYEVALYVDGKVVKVLGYTARKTNKTLLNYAASNSTLLKSHLTEEELDMEWKNSSKTGLMFANGRVIVRYTGKTERTVASEMGKLV